MVQHRKREEVDVNAIWSGSEVGAENIAPGVGRLPGRYDGKSIEAEASSFGLRLYAYVDPLEHYGRGGFRRKKRQFDRKAAHNPQ